VSITRALGVVAIDNSTGQPLAGAQAMLQGHTGTITCDDAVCLTNTDGYTWWPVVVVGDTYQLTIHKDGFHTQTLTVVVTASTTDPQVRLVRIGPPPPTESELHHVQANFCNLTDQENRVIFTADLAGLDPATRHAWLTQLIAAGSTHVVLSPMGGNYPGTPFSPFNLLGQPEAFAQIVREIMTYTGPNGKALTPVVLLDGGEAGFTTRIDQYWDGIAAALNDVKDRILIVPGWELIKASEVTSAEYAYALTVLHRQGWPHIWAHLSPGRASASSNPVEDDDPWQGAESGMWKSHGGEFVEGLLYQSEAVRPNDDRCDPADDGCWLNRWEDVVPRIGAGMNGWRVMHLVYFEGPAYYYYRRQSDSAFARQIATKAKAMCDKYQVVCGFGNGLPEKE
jgi:hypothetical protein